MTAPARKPPWKVWVRIGLWLAILYVMFRWFEQHQVYQPSSRLETTGRELKRPFEDVTFTATDGVQLHGWFFPAEASAAHAQRVFLLCHGNAGNISHRLGHVAALLDTGASVFVFDYRGYGKSRGRPSEEGTYGDAQGAYAWLRQRGCAPTNIVALGESLGGGVVSELALRESLGGLALLSSFTSVPDLGAELFPWLPVRSLGTIRYDTRRKLPRIRVPLIIVHSRADTLVPFHHAERNLAAAQDPKELWEIYGDHNDFLSADRERYVEGLRRFLARLP